MKNMVEEIPYVTITLFGYDSPLSTQKIYEKLSSKKNIEHWAVDKRNRNKSINIECEISGIEKTSSGIHGNFTYNEQLKERNSDKYRIYETFFSFTISPSLKIVIIYGSSSSAKQVRTILEEFLHPNELEIRHFSQYTIPKGKMYSACKKILDANNDNFCERPRVTHGNKKFQGHTFHDYSNGYGQCAMRTESFKKEFSNATAISPILKVKYCPDLMDDDSGGYKTIRFKHEGTIYFSGSAYPSDWRRFLSNMLLS